MNNKNNDFILNSMEHSNSVHAQTYYVITYKDLLFMWKAYCNLRLPKRLL